MSKARLFEEMDRNSSVRSEEFVDAVLLRPHNSPDVVQMSDMLVMVSPDVFVAIFVASDEVAYHCALVVSAFRPTVTQGCSLVISSYVAPTWDIA